MDPPRFPADRGGPTGPCRTRASSDLPDPASYDTTRPGIVLDKVTGLMWEQADHLDHESLPPAASYCDRRPDRSKPRTLQTARPRSARRVTPRKKTALVATRRRPATTSAIHPDEGSTALSDSTRDP